MSYESLLTDTCSIFHLNSRSSGGKWGIPSDDRQQDHYYADNPDVEEQSCYFVEKNQSITQGEPNNEIIQTYRVHFPIDADIQINDKVVWEGITLKAQKPRNIKDHHIEVNLVRRVNL
ncbi:protein of unknown function [Gracilibacillus orientalis]|uniref:DUF3599 domain-containing protein n=1 Tax=Gracilibacillus orientalis TaxID=334253 RepID=A0A1I4PNA6_9BACI|nr:DUF3599 family protein [Gracilibacillus orientalis]SFM29086.1 protein of unknown function [Gracilibacillus orientalis]